MPSELPIPSARSEPERTKDVPISRARWAIASVLTIASLGAVAVSIDDPARAPFVQADAPQTQHAHAARAESEEPDDRSIVRLIDINAAPAPALEMLPLIGPVRAQRIVDDRNANGPFARLDDLDRVPGIGPKTIERLRPLACALPGDPN